MFLFVFGMLKFECVTDCSRNVSEEMLLVLTAHDGGIVKLELLVFNWHPSVFKV